MSSSKNYKIGGAILLLLLLGLAGYFFKKNSDLEKSQKIFAQEKLDLTTELDSIVVNYDNILAEKANLNRAFTDSLEVERKKIILLRKDIKKLKGNSSYLRKKLNTFESKVFNLKQDNVILKIAKDSLIRVNTMLRIQVDSTTTALTNERDYSKKLETQNTKLAQKVLVGSKLNAINISSQGVKVKNSGKVVSTRRSRRADKIKVCFTLNKNEIADAEQKEIFVVVENPEKVLLNSGAGNSFTLNGSSKKYSSKTLIYYEKKNLEMCIFVDAKEEELIRGDYNIYLYTKKGMIGQSKLYLK